MHHLHTAIYHATYPKSWIVMNTIFFTCLIVLFFPAIQHTDSNCRLPIWKKIYFYFQQKWSEVPADRSAWFPRKSGNRTPMTSMQNIFNWIRWIQQLLVCVAINYKTVVMTRLISGLILTKDSLAAELAVSSDVFRFTLTTRLPCCLLTNMSLPFSTFQEYVRDTSEIPEF